MKFARAKLILVLIGSKILKYHRHKRSIVTCGFWIDSNVFDIVSDPVALFLTVGLSPLFGYFFREIAGKIKERFKPEIQVAVKSAVHKFDAGLFLHNRTSVEDVLIT